MPAASGTGLGLIEGRSCGTCSLCCILPDIDELDKPANVVCRHCAVGDGCVAYATRPATCRDFFCLWRTDDSWGAHWDPAVSGMMAYAQGPQLTVLVDPARGEDWRRAPYLGELQARAEALKVGGGYVVVFAGEDVEVVKT
ncbi:MAG: hypothetical protein QE284_10695 [Rhizobium sp.]|nr:hypothetical protein [Rhizobium sp.]